MSLDKKESVEIHWEELDEVRSAYLMVKNSTDEELSSSQEFMEAMQFAGFNPTQRTLRNHWPSGGAHARMTFNQFATIVDIEPKPSEKCLNGAFEKLDDRQLGYITHEDFLTDMTTRGDKLDEDVVRRLLSDDKYNRDNKFYYKEFAKDVINTTQTLKQLALERLRGNEKLELQRNSRTFKVKRKHSQPSPIKVQPAPATIAKTDRSMLKHVDSKKGCFYVEEDTIIGHQYTLIMSESSPVIVTIKAGKRYRYSGQPAHMELFGFDADKRFLFRANTKAGEDVWEWEGMLEQGSYLLIPWASGARLKRRPETRSPDKRQLVQRAGSGIKLTPDFENVLKDIFQKVDLDGNGLLSREEFNLFNWRTSGEQVADEEWEVVEENFPLQDGELTLEGFLALHQMEAEDNEGDCGELWLTLNSNGYNHQLQQDESASFTVEVSATITQPRLVLSGLKSGGLILDKTITRLVMEGNREPVRAEGPSGSRIFIYQEVTKDSGSLVVQNKSERSLTVAMDLTPSSNILTNRPSLKFQVEIGKKSAAMLAQVLPLQVDREWKLKFNAKVT